MANADFLISLPISLPRLDFGLSQRADLRLAVRRPRHLLVVQRRWKQSGDPLDGINTLSRSHVGQERWAGDIADCINARNVRSHLRIHWDEATICAYSDRFEAKVVRVALDADADEHSLGPDRFALARVVDDHADASFLVCDFDYLTSRPERHPLFVKRALDNRADLLVFEGEEPGKLLDDGDLSAVASRDVCELAANRATADDHYGAWRLP